MKKGFTLIELLIVVAIIAILAAIAVPNFLEAQVRSKVSRVKSDMRTLATAVESYQVDWNKPAPCSMTGGPGPFAPVESGGTGTLTYAITTPVAYLSSFTFFDPFVNADSLIPYDEKLFSWHPYHWKWNPPTSSTPTPDSSAAPTQGEYNGLEFQEYYGSWRMLSIGPDRDYTSRYPRSWNQPMRAGVPYDATNGTVSLGNIIRSQKEGEQKKFKPLP